MTQRSRKERRAAARCTERERAKAARRRPFAPEGRARGGPGIEPGREASGAQRGVRFALSFGALFATLELVFVAWFHGTEAFDAYLAWTAGLGARILNALGTDVAARGRELSGAAALSVESGCDGLQPLLLFACAVVAFPLGWRPKLAALAAGAPAILALNVARVVTLYPALLRDRELFEELHQAAWPIAFMLFALLAWGLWVSWATPSRGSAARSVANLRPDGIAEEPSCAPAP